MPKSKQSKTKQIAKKKKRNTTAKDVPGSGMAKNAAKAIQRRHQLMSSI